MTEQRLLWTDFASTESHAVNAVTSFRAGWDRSGRCRTFVVLMEDALRSSISPQHVEKW